MAEMSGAPFIKVEATKFTEVGYKGAGYFEFFLFLCSPKQDVDSIIKDLLEIAIKLVSQREEEKSVQIIKQKTEDVILDHLLGSQVDQRTAHLREEMRTCLRESGLDDIEIPYEEKTSK